MQASGWSDEKTGVDGAREMGSKRMFLLRAGPGAPGSPPCEQPFFRVY